MKETLNKNKSSEIPVISQEIIEAINYDRLVIFVGAGASALSDLPLWNKLAHVLLESCKKERYISEGNFELLNEKVKDSKQIISISYEIYRKNGNENGFYEKFRGMLRVNKNKVNLSEPVYEFCQITNALVLTSNADNLVDKYFKSQLISYDIKKIQMWRKQGPALVKIHGSIKNKDSLVFTASQYLERYNNTSFQSYLKSIFKSDKTILFIGYGANEFELLQYIFGQFINDPNGPTYSRFILNGYYTYEEAVRDSMDLYYRTLGIKQICYSKDINGYNELNEVVKSWLKVIKDKTSLKKNSINKLKVAIDNDNVSQVLQLTKNSADNADYLFSELRKRDNKLEWIDKLITTELFSPKLCMTEIKCKTKDDRDSSEDCRAWPGLSFIYDIANSELCEKLMSKKHIVILIKNSINCVLKNNLLSLNYRNIYLLCGLLAKYPNNILGNTLFVFFKAVVKLNNCIGEYLSFLVSEKNSLFQWSKNDILSLFNIVFDKLNDDVMSIDSLKNFLNMYYATLDPNIPTELINESCNYILKKENDNRLVFGEFGSVYLFDCDDSDRKEIIIFNFMRSMIESSVPTSLRLLTFLTNVDKNSFLQRLGIFAINVHYNELKKYLYDDTNNPFDNYSIYSDLYYLIRNNKNIISKNEYSLLYEWVNKCKFGRNESKESEYIDILRYDLITLILDAYPSLNQGVIISKPKNYDKCKTIDSRNKLYELTFKFGPENEDIKKDFENLELFDIGHYLKNESANKKHDFDDYENAFREAIKKFDLASYSVEKICKEIPVKYYPIIVESIADKCDQNNISFYLKLFETLLNEYIDLTSDLNSLSLFFVELDKMFSRKKIDNVYIEKACQIILDTLKNKWDIYNSEYKKSSIKNIPMEILNDWYCYGIYILLVQLATCNSKTVKIKVFKFIDSILARDDIVILLKTTVAYCLNILNSIDKKWVDLNISKIIVNKNDIIAAACGGAYFPAFYNIVVTIDKLQEIYAYSNKKDISVMNSLAKISVFYSVINGTEVDDYLKKILKISGISTLGHIYKQLFSMLKGKDLENSNSCLVYVCEFVVNNNIKINEETDWVIKCLCKCLLQIMNRNSIDAIIWKCLYYLASGFSDIFSDEINECFLAYFNKYPKEIADIISEMVFCSKDWAFTYDKSICILISKISKRKRLRDEFNIINNVLIKRGVYDFTGSSDIKDVTKY